MKTLSRVKMKGVECSFDSSGTTGSRGSRKSDSIIDGEDNEVILRPKSAPVARSISTASNGTANEAEVSQTEETRRTPRTKEEIELSNLKKKTRKRTRRFEVDGVVITTTTNKVRRFCFSRTLLVLSFTVNPAFF